MQGIKAMKSVAHTRIQGFVCVCVCVGGVQTCLPENNHDNFLVLNFNSLHFTVIERRSGIRACPHRNQDNSSTEQFVDTFFETTRRQIVRQLVHIFFFQN